MASVRPGTYNDSEDRPSGKEKPETPRGLERPVAAVRGLRNTPGAGAWLVKADQASTKRSHPRLYRPDGPSAVVCDQLIDRATDAVDDHALLSKPLVHYRRTTGGRHPALTHSLSLR